MTLPPIVSGAVEAGYSLSDLGYIEAVYGKEEDYRNALKKAEAQAKAQSAVDEGGGEFDELFAFLNGLEGNQKLFAYLFLGILAPPLILSILYVVYNNFQ